MSAPLTRTEQLATPAPLDVVLDLHAADLHLVAEAGRTTTDVEITVSGNRAAEVIGQVTVTLSGERLDIRAPRVGWFGVATRVAVRAWIPEQSRVRGGGGSGDIVLDGAYTAAEVRSGSGDLRVDQAQAAELATGSGDVVVAWAGTVSARAGSGDVTIGRAGTVRATSGSGDVRIDAAETVTAKSGSGKVELGGVVSQATVTAGSGSVHVEEVAGEAKLRSGSGRLSLDRLRSGHVDLGSGSGALRIGVPFGTAVKVDADARSGRVRSDLGQVADGSGHDLTASIHARSGSGDITISRAD